MEELIFKTDDVSYATVKGHLDYSKLTVDYEKEASLLPLEVHLNWDLVLRPQSALHSSFSNRQ